MPVARVIVVSWIPRRTGELTMESSACYGHAVTDSGGAEKNEPPCWKQDGSGSAEGPFPDRPQSYLNIGRQIKPGFFLPLL